MFIFHVKIVLLYHLIKKVLFVLFLFKYGIVVYAVVYRPTRVYALHLIESDSSLIFHRFEVAFHEGLNCGGAYVKLLSADNKLDLVGTCTVPVHYLPQYHYLLDHSHLY